jgi:hypothetical protein
MRKNTTNRLSPAQFESSVPSAEPMRVEVLARRWTMRVIALLLAGQAVILVTIIWLAMFGPNHEQEFSDVMGSMSVMDTLLLGGLLFPLAIFDLFIAAGLWFAKRGAWLQAMTAQGILLIFCLSSYVTHRGERFIYLLMLTCIVIVLYLNTYDVRLSFTSRESKSTNASR